MKGSFLTLVLLATTALSADADSPESPRAASTQTLTSTTIVTLDETSDFTFEVPPPVKSIFETTLAKTKTRHEVETLFPYTPPGFSHTPSKDEDEDSSHARTDATSPEPATSQKPTETSEPATTQEPVETESSQKPAESSEVDTTEAHEDTSTSEAQAPSSTDAPSDPATSAPVSAPATSSSAPATSSSASPTGRPTLPPLTVKELTDLDATVSELKNTLGSILTEIPNAPRLQQLVTNVAATVEGVLGRLAGMLASAPTKRHIMGWLMKRDDTADLTNEVRALLVKLRDIVGLITPMENKSDALSALLESLKGTIGKLEAWLATVTAPNPTSEAASGSGGGSERTPSSGGAVTASDEISRVDIDHGSATPAVSAPVETSTKSVTLTTTQTVTHCENNACSHIVVVVTTCVPEVYTVTECPTVVEDKTITITVPCEIETEAKNTKTTASESKAKADTPKTKADTPKTASATQYGSVPSTPKPAPPKPNETSTTCESRAPQSNVPVAEKSEAPKTGTPQSSAATPKKEESNGGDQKKGPAPAPVETVETRQTTWTSVSASQTTTITCTVLVTRTVGPAAPSQANSTVSVAQANSGQKLAVGGMLLLPLLMV